MLHPKFNNTKTFSIFFLSVHKSHTLKIIGVRGQVKNSNEVFDPTYASLSASHSFESLAFFTPYLHFFQMSYF